MFTTPDPRRAASRLFPVLAYAEEEGLFLLEDRSLGFGFLCEPLSGADPAVADRVNVLLNQEWPVDSLVQVSLWTSPDLDATLARMQARRLARTEPVYRNLVQGSIDFLRQGTRTPLESVSGTRLRHCQVVVTVKLPLAHPQPSDADLQRAAELRLASLQSLTTIGLRPETLQRRPLRAVHDRPPELEPGCRLARPDRARVRSHPADPRPAVRL